MLQYSKLYVLVFVLGAAGSVAYASNAATAGQQANVEHLKGNNLINKAKITLADARVIALKAHSGTITDEELELEKGGSGLRYSFDIKGAKGTQEVGVDAKTGKVLENKPDGPNPD